jgi:hypothetical protein
VTAKDNTVLERESQDLVELTRTSGDALGRAVTEAIARTSAKGARIPSVAVVLDLLAGALEASVNDAGAAQAALVAERADDGPLLAKRDRQARALAEQLVEGRASITGAFGDGAAAELGFVGATPSDARALVKLARTVSDRASKVKLGPARKGVKIDVPAVFEGVAERASALDTTLSELAREGREETEALVKRDPRARVGERPPRGTRVGPARALHVCRRPRPRRAGLRRRRRIERRRERASEARGRQEGLRVCRTIPPVVGIAARCRRAVSRRFTAHPVRFHRRCLPASAHGAPTRSGD